MKITGVRLQPAGAEDYLTLGFRDPQGANPYNIKSLSGLDADEIVPRYYGGPGGAKYYNLSLERRDIVVFVSLNPEFSTGKSYSDLRDDLYRAISSSRTGIIEVQFMEDETIVATISGFMSKFETSLFTKEPEVQMTLQCDDPMLRSPEQIDIDVSGLNPAFTVVTDEVSTAPHGVKLRFNIDESISQFKLGDPDQTWSLLINYNFQAGDVLCISTEFFNKHLHLHRGEEEIHVSDKIAYGSIWPIIFPGDNKFIVSQSDKISWNAIWYHHAYWGV